MVILSVELQPFLVTVSSYVVLEVGDGLYVLLVDNTVLFPLTRQAYEAPLTIDAERVILEPEQIRLEDADALAFGDEITVFSIAEV
tara:strand:- start:44 stop:301 length:258 start_codon:yes stop_codon:yes gene_type:complete